MKKKTVFLLLQYAVFFGLGFALIYMQYKNLSPQDIADLQTSLAQVAERWWILIFVGIIGIASHVFRALRWQLLLEPLDIRPNFINTIGAVFIGYLTNLLLPRMGEVAKCTVIARYEHKPADKIIGTIVAERAFDMICLLLITALTFAIQANIITDYLVYLSEGFEDKNLPMLVGIGILALILFIAFLVFLYKKTKNGKIGAFIKGLAEGVNAILAMKKRGLFLLHTFLIWASYLAIIIVCFLALPATEDLGIGAALSILVFGSIGMIITPGGLGAYPQAIKMVLSMLYGVKQAFGLAFGWISWLSQTIIIIVVGILAFLVLPIFNKNKDEQARLDTA